MLRNLAQQIETLRSGTTPSAASSGNNATPEPVSSESSVPKVMKIEDLKNKAARLIEQADRHNRDMSNFGPVMHRVDLIENEVERWWYRLPNMLLGDQMDEITTAIELQEEFHAFKAADRRRIEEIREVVTPIEERVHILCRSHDDT